MKNLPAHEWLIIVLLIVTLLMLTFITFIWNKSELPPTTVSHALSNELVQVTIQGAVKKPGIYEFPKGANLKQLVATAEPLPEANLERLKMNSKLRDGQLVKIPLQRWINIKLEGAVAHPGTIKVKQGTLLEDLVDFVQFQPDADLDKLQKKRRLRDEEVIIVPKRKARKKKLNETLN